MNNPVLSRLNIILAGVLAIVTLAGFLLVPLDASLPVHWGLDGQPDGFAPAPIALLIPVLMSAIVIGLLLVLRPAGLQKDFEAGRHLIRASTSVILMLAILISAANTLFGMGHAVEMTRLIAMAMAVLLIIMGNYLPKTQPNWIAGIRLPWTLRSPENWRITHFWGGRLMMVGGLAALVVAIFNPTPPVLLIALLGAIFLPILASVYISYSLARRGV